MTPPLEKALQLLGSGNWQEAHVIAQADDSAHGCWIHGLVHWLEGDRTNARYWYRRAGRSFPPLATLRTKSPRWTRVWPHVRVTDVPPAPKA